MPKRPRPWLVTPDTRKNDAGRPRSGPDGVAVRELARITVRASALTLARWDALRERTGMPVQDLFEHLVNSFIAATMTTDQAADLVRDAKRRRRTDYPAKP